MKIYKEAFGGWDHGYGSYLDCSDDVIDVCISQKIYIVCYKYFDLLCTNLTSVKVLN